MITTDRLILRRWEDRDIEPYVALNQDPRVTEFAPGIQPREESEAEMRHFNALLDQRGHAFWAVEERASGRLAGATGLLPTEGLPMRSDGIEIGWRFACAFWGKGYATEAARACLAFGFETLGVTQIVAFTMPANARSRAVMDRLGMTYAEGEDFDYPHAPEGHPFRRQVLYRITLEQWKTQPLDAVADR